MNTNSSCVSFVIIMPRYEVKYLKPYSILQNGKWVDKKEAKWVPFYPISNLMMEEYGGGLDERPAKEVLKHNTIYGKAVIGFCGGQPVYEYYSYPKKDVRVVQ